eukprot:7673909-Alexandrium_andersonii.AAC.1
MAPFGLPLTAQVIKLKVRFHHEWLRVNMPLPMHRAEGPPTTHEGLTPQLQCVGLKVLRRSELKARRRQTRVCSPSATNASWAEGPPRKSG